LIGAKNRFAKVLYLNILGIEDVVDTIMNKAVDRELVSDNDNIDRIKFDKIVIISFILVSNI
jgi:hypothetical protein